jgi:hypothetical protein
MSTEPQGAPGLGDLEKELTCSVSMLFEDFIPGPKARGRASAFSPVILQAIAPLHLLNNPVLWFHSFVSNLEVDSVSLMAPADHYARSAQICYFSRSPSLIAFIPSADRA